MVTSARQGAAVAADPIAPPDGPPAPFALHDALRIPSVSIVIPARNEGANLPDLLRRLPLGLHEVILVDGHSTDDTVAAARAAYPAIRVIQQSRRGKGNALCCGFAEARGDIIVMLDADGSADPAEIPRFVAALCTGADVAKGSRFLHGAGSDDLTPLRRLGNSSLCRLVNLLYHARYTDLCYGYNAFWRHHLPALRADCDGFEIETLINVRAARARLCVHEVSSFERRRASGTSNLRPFRDGWRVFRVILAERFARDDFEAADSVATGRDGAIA